MSLQESLRVTLVQTDIYWEDIPANLASLEEKLAQLNGSSDLIILPEMFSTGFSMEPEKIAEPLNLVTTRWLRQMSLASNAMIIGSFVARDGSSCYNRLMAVRPDGTYHYYDKRHLFRMGGEHNVYTAGSEILTVSWRGWKIRPMVCYDLRFPVWSRNTEDNSYDLLIYVANWPAIRNFAWETLLKARAIENLSYVAGVNRIGTDANGIEYIGNSALIDFRGQSINTVGNKPDLVTYRISKPELENFREQFPAYLDSDRFDFRL